MRSGVSDYQAWHQRMLVPLVPPPPAPWKDLSAEMDSVDARIAARPRFSASRASTRPDAVVKRPRLWWGLAAAAAALLIVAYVRLPPQSPSVQAAELLEKAVTGGAACPSGYTVNPLPYQDSRFRTASGLLLKTAPAQGGGLPDSLPPLTVRLGTASQCARFRRVAAPPDG